MSGLADSDEEESGHGPGRGSLTWVSPGRPPRDVRWIFLGPQGLRAGWSILLFAGIFLMLLMVSGFFLGHFVHLNPTALSPRAGLLFELWQFAVVLITTWLMSVFERRPLRFYGYQGRGRTVRFFSGLFWGLTAISAMILLLWKLGYLALEGETLRGVAAWKYAVAWGFVFLLTGFFEESLLRGYAQFTLSRGLGFWWGALLLSALFGLTHKTNPGESPVGLFSAAAIGLVFCLSLWYTGSLWWAVGFHAAWDWGQSFLYGTADSGMVAQGHLVREHPLGPILWSGGSTGPEGSVLVIPLLLVFVVAMVLWWGRRARSPFAGAAWRSMRMQPGEMPYRDGAGDFRNEAAVLRIPSE